MWRGFLLVLALTGCTALQPASESANTTRFEGSPEKSVIYLVREHSLSSPQPLVVVLDGATEGLTYPGTFLRWEVMPGAHRIAGFAADAGAIDLVTESGRSYFVHQTVSRVQGLLQSEFRTLSEQDGRSLIVRSRILALS